MASACTHIAKTENRLTEASFLLRVNIRYLPLEGFQFGVDEGSYFGKMKAGDEGQQRAGLCLQRARLLRETPNSARTPRGQNRVASGENSPGSFQAGTGMKSNTRAEEVTLSQVGLGNTTE